MNVITIYLERTDKDGQLTVTEHRVWDAKIFMDARRSEAAKEGGKSSAKQITREDYLAATAPRRAA